MSDLERLESRTSSKRPVKSPLLTLQAAVDMGEYDPEYLATFPEWHQLSRHMQFQLIQKALDNRRKQLLSQWAAINNVLDYSQKPHLEEAKRNNEKQLGKVMEDKEKLFVEYSK